MPSNNGLVVLPSIPTGPITNFPSTTVWSSEIIDSLNSDALTPVRIASIVEKITETISITNDQATAFAASSQVLENINGNQADQIFRDINSGEITDAQGEAIVETVQIASKTVRRSFEGELNIFEGQFDNYVPLNSKINVEDSRTVVAVSVVSTAALTSMGVREVRCQWVVARRVAVAAQNLLKHLNRKVIAYEESENTN